MTVRSRWHSLLYHVPLSFAHSVYLKGVNRLIGLPFASLGFNQYSLFWTPAALYRGLKLKSTSLALAAGGSRKYFLTQVCV